ncbi:11068_t:CDS:10 [Racocetra fulgida]|uniref:ATP-dependent DNA helicase n=1 Tax=Racocetra fulgida TaxID=60492 RepID=A0A9N8VC03_9GLOM|nr:11068_t:CDS:10 [Racocetra fulgida]
MEILEKLAELTSKQKRVMELALQGQNVFFTGAAGTGKSYLLQKLITSLQEKYGKKHVGVTATSGIGAEVIGGTTLHSFLGIGIDSNLSVEELLDRILTSRSSYARKNWRKIKVLIIDEISMLGGELFDKLESLARQIRQNEQPFGGVQLILAGDFCQLPPDIRLGRFSKSRWEKFVSLLAREPTWPDDGIRPVSLYATIQEAEATNNQELVQLPGPSYLFAAEDQEKAPGKLKELIRDCLAPEKLELKIGAQVMLITNYLEKKLVNGSQGVVIEKIESYDNNNRPAVSATRTQIPLILRQTIERLKVDLSKCFVSGQIYVALSRASDPQFLQVINFPYHKNYPRNVSEGEFANARIEEPDRAIDEFANRYQKKFKLLHPKDNDAPYAFLSPEDAEFLSAFEMEYSHTDFGNAFLSRTVPTVNSRRDNTKTLNAFFWEEDEFFMGKLLLEKKVLTRLQRNKDYNRRDRGRIGQRLEGEEINEYPGLEGNLDLREFSGLEEVHLPGFRLTGLLLSDSVYGKLEKLTTINCQKNRLQSLNLDFCPSLKILNCSDNNLTSLDLKNNKKLISLDCSNNSINQLTFPSNSLLATSSGENQPPEENDFSGLLAGLQRCGNLELMVAVNQTKIQGNPANSLYLFGNNMRHFYCQNTIFQTELEPFNYNEREARELAEKKVKGLENRSTEEIKKLAAKELEEKERTITSLRDEIQRLTGSLSFKEGKIKSLNEKLAKEENNNAVVESPVVVCKETQTLISETENKEIIKKLEEKVRDLERERSELKEKEKEFVKKETEILLELKEAGTQTDKNEQPPTEKPASSVTTGQLSLHLAGSALFNPNKEERINADLSAKIQESINIAEQAIAKEKEIMELRRKLFQIERARINKHHEEKMEEISLILQHLKNTL